MELKLEKKAIPDLNCIQNTLIIDSDKIAVAYIYPTPEFTLSWFLEENTDYYHLIDWCMDQGRIFETYNQKYSKLNIEYWIDDEYFDTKIDQKIINNCSTKYLLHLPSPLELLQISCAGLALELLFDVESENLDRITLLFNEIKPTVIGELFQTFHSDNRVRKKPDIWRLAFKKGLFKPLITMEGISNAEAG